MRTCTKCRTPKDLSDFYQKTSGRLSSWCKECARAATRARTEKPVVDGRCGCGRPLRRQTNGNRATRACTVCRGLAEPCSCGGWKSKGAKECRECLRSHAQKLNARVCPSCGGPKSYHSTNCIKCVRAMSPGRKVTGDDYVLIRTETGQWRSEHIVIMEGLLGRRLLPGETVHHKNGVKHDNVPSNLELFVVNQPRGQRPEDLVPWAQEILRRYSTLVLD